MIEAAKPTAQPTSASPPSQGAGESRFDPVTGNWTLFAPHRSERPDEFVESRERIRPQVACPFCPGNETKTPPAVWIGHSENNEPVAKERQQPTELSQQQTAVKNEWAVRVVPNKFPAVVSVGETDGTSCTDPQRLSGNHATSASESALFQRCPIAGGHEVIIESRNHVQSITELDVAEGMHSFSKRIETGCDIGVTYPELPTSALSRM